MDYLSEFRKEFKGLRVRKSFKEDVEPEEILLDAQKSADFAEQKIETPLRARVFIIFFTVIILGLVLLAGRAGYLEILKNKDYAALAARNSLRVFPVAAPRGLIYDKDLKALVSNLPSYNIFLAPQDLPIDKTERETMIEQISFLLELNPKDVNKQLLEFDFEKEQRIMLVSALSSDKILALQSRLADFPALTLERGVQRQYIYGDVLSHVLGYTGRITKDDLGLLSEGYSSEARIGKSGLEAEYEKILKGQEGQRQVEVDAKSRQIKELGFKDSVAGENIVTTIDLELQKKIFEVVSRVLNSSGLSKAAVVALEPKSGRVLGLVSTPSFNDNLFEKNIPAGEIKNLLEEPSQPLFNRAIAGQYPSGSTIKPMIAGAALEENIVTPSTTVYDPGQITVVNQYDPSIVYNFLDWKAHGLVNIYSAIAQSCDVYFYTVGGGYGKIDGLGISRIKKYLELFGLGAVPAIDLPGAKAGLVPDPSWKQSAKNEQWFLGDTYHVSIGQGDLLVTPLQMALAIGAIANGGQILKPYLVDKIIDSDKNSIKVFEPSILRGNFIKSENLAVVRKGMREAVTSGSAGTLADLAVKVAGKTGTAQVAGQLREDAWFVGFAPYDDPKIVLAVVVENAGEGSSVSVPIAKEIFNWYFSR